MFLRIDHAMTIRQSRIPMKRKIAFKIVLQASSIMLEIFEFHLNPQSGFTFQIDLKKQKLNFFRQMHVIK
jgi:hypothetical protein